MDFFHLLPNELQYLIKNYLPIIILVFTNKQNYLTYHYNIRKSVNPKNLEKYFRQTIIQDHSFVFSLLLRENYSHWMKITNYRYKNFTFSNYINFLKAFFVEHNSFSCYNVLKAWLEELGLNKNQHKKNIGRNIKNG